MEIGHNIVEDLWTQYDDWTAKGSPNEERGKDKGKDKDKDDDDWFKECIEVDKDIDPEFKIMGQIIGTGGRNVSHIRKQTGAKVGVRGENHDRDIYVEVKAPTQAAVDEATKLVHSLLETAYKEYDEWCETHGSKGRRVT